MIGAGCQLWKRCWQMACHPKPSRPLHAKAPVNAQLGLSGYMVDARSQLINNCFTYIHTKDQVILTLFIADEINYWIQTLGIIFPMNSCPDLASIFNVTVCKIGWFCKLHISASICYMMWKKGSTQHRVSQSQMQMGGNLIKCYK